MEYRTQIPVEFVAFLTEPGGTLGEIADHMRDPRDDSEAGWIYLDEVAMAKLRALPADSDGVATDEGIWFGGVVYPVEVVQS